MPRLKVDPAVKSTVTSEAVLLQRKGQLEESLYSANARLFLVVSFSSFNCLARIIIRCQFRPLVFTNTVSRTHYCSLRPSGPQPATRTSSTLPNPLPFSIPQIVLFDPSLVPAVALTIRSARHLLLTVHLSLPLSFQMHMICLKWSGTDNR